MKTETTILIVGGGFAGIRCALNLAKAKLSNTRIRLISPLTHFEYHAALYRVVTGGSPLEVCIPLDHIFRDMPVEIIRDTITTIKPTKKIAQGTSGTTYRYDMAVVATGSQTSYFSIPGLEKYSFGFKSIHEALQLKNHLHQLLCIKGSRAKQKNGRIVVIGGGASGVELAGELAVYLHRLAKTHHFPPSLIHIELVEATDRLLGKLPPDMGNFAEHRLRRLGVKVILGHKIEHQTLEEVVLDDRQLPTHTVVWTAGVQTNSLYQSIQGLQFDTNGRVLISKTLEAEGVHDLYVAGDAASSRYSGMAQTAIQDAHAIAATISARLKGQSEETRYLQHAPAYAIPVGRNWAVVLYQGIIFTGLIGWILRRLADMRFFLTILKPAMALSVFREGDRLSESCPECLHYLRTID